MSRLRLPMLVMLALSPALPAEAQPRFSGFVEYDNLTYFESRERQKVNGRNQVILQPEIRHQAGPKANIFGAVELRYDQADPSRNRVFLDEAYVNLYQGPVDLRVGRQTFAWGRADAFNPTDNLTAWDFSDILDTDDEKLGLVSARATYYAGDWSLEAVVAPSFTASVLPGTDSRWWLELPAFVENTAYPRQGPPLLNARYTFADEELPDEGLENTQFAVKVTGLVRGWDFSASWFDGYDDLPALHLDTTTDPADTTAAVAVEPRYHRRRALGADVATTFGSVGVHGEVAYYVTEDWSGSDPAVDDPYLHYVVGADYTFDKVLPGKDLFVLVEWSQEVQVPDRNTVYRLTDLNHIFRKSVLGKADLDLGDFSKLTLEGVYGLPRKDWLLRAGLKWSVVDGLELNVRVDLPGGPRDSFFGSFEGNRRLQTHLRYFF